MIGKQSGSGGLVQDYQLHERVLWIRSDENKPESVLDYRARFENYQSLKILEFDSDSETEFESTALV